MEESKIISTYLAQMSRLALKGKREDAKLYLNRMARKLSKIDQVTYKEVIDLAATTYTRSSPLRNSAFEAIPVDRDTRNNLLRQDYPVNLHEEVYFSENVQSEIESLLKEQMQADLLLDHELEPANTIIFTGAPGVGKTLTAKFIAEKLNLPLLTLDLSTVMSSFLGRTGNNIKNIFEYANGMRCVLLLDELDTIAKKRDDASEVGELKRLVNVLLQEIDSWSSNNVLIAATNHAKLLDPAIWRRFDKVVEFPLPTQIQIQNYISNKITLSAKDAKLTVVLAKILFGASYSDLNRICKTILKNNILSHETYRDLIIQEIAFQLNLRDLQKDDKIEVALELRDQKVSERQVAEITGLARDTVRKRKTTKN